MKVNEKTINKIIVKKGSMLTKKELLQIKEAIFREFKVRLSNNDQTKDKLFFFLKQKGLVLAMGALWEVKPVILGKESFVIYGVLNVVANIKGKGYGKQVVTTMKKYLASRDKTILGFCMPKNAGFYKKCGFNIDLVSTKRFVCKKGKNEITNKDGQKIFYKDSSDHFMEKVLENPKIKVLIPTTNLW